MKYAIRIVDGATGKTKLFAIAKDARYMTQLRYCAKRSIGSDSSDWVTVDIWTMHITPHWSEFPAGDLF